MLYIIIIILVKKDSRKVIQCLNYLKKEKTNDNQKGMISSIHILHTILIQ